MEVPQPEKPDKPATPECWGRYMEPDSPWEADRGLCAERCPHREACWRKRKERHDAARR